MGSQSPLWIPPYRRVSYRPPGPSITGRKRILPRLWDVVSSPNSSRRKLRSVRFWPTIDIEAVDQWFPLDGEEGELVEDEGFLDALEAPNINFQAGPSTPTTITNRESQSESLPKSSQLDIISLLPPEIGLQVFLYLDLNALAAVAAVSRYWSTLSRDMQIWRELFYRQPHWAVNPGRAARQRIRMNSKASHASSTFATPSALYSRWGRNSLLSLRSVWTSEHHQFEVPPLTLALNWSDMYKTRLEIDRRWDHSEPRVNRLVGHSDRQVKGNCRLCGRVAHPSPALSYIACTASNLISKRSSADLATAASKSGHYLRASFWLLYEDTKGLFSVSNSKARQASWCPEVRIAKS